MANGECDRQDKPHIGLHPESDLCWNWREQPAPTEPSAPAGTARELAIDILRNNRQNFLGPNPKMAENKITVLSNRIQRYAAEQVRQATDERNAYINALIDKQKAEVRELRQERDALKRDFKSQEILAVSWEQQYIAAIEKEEEEREARERAEGALRKAITIVETECCDGQCGVIDSLQALKSRQEEGKL